MHISLQKDSIRATSQGSQGNLQLKDAWPVQYAACMEVIRGHTQMLILSQKINTISKYSFSCESLISKVLHSHYVYINRDT